MMLADGYFRASSATTVMRSAASLRSGAPRAAANSGSIAPPSTTMPAGTPRAASQGGNRFSSGSINALPSGNSPNAANSAIDAITSPRPARANRVYIKASPMSPSINMSLDGSAKKPRILETTKNIGCKTALAGSLAPLRIARLGFIIRRIEARQLGALFHLGEYPALIKLVLGAFMGDEIEQVLGDHHGAVVVG